MKQHAWILAAGLAAVGLQPASAQEGRLAPLPDTPTSTMVGDTTAEAATLPPSQRWRSWMGLSARLLARMTDARRDGDTAAFADLARAYEEAMRNGAQAARGAGTGRDVALRHVESAIGRHRAVLEGFLDRVPAEARVHVEASMTAADNSHDVVLAALGGEPDTIAAGTVEVTPDTPAVVTPPIVRPAGQVTAGAGAADMTVVAPQDVEPTRPTADTNTTRRTRRSGAAATAPATVAPGVPGVAVPGVSGVGTPGVVGGVGTPGVVGGGVPIVPGVNVPAVPGVNVPVVPGVNTPFANQPLVPGVNTPLVPGVNTPFAGTPAGVPAVPGVNVPAVPGVNVPAGGGFPNGRVPNGRIPNIRGGFSPNLLGPAPLGSPAAPGGIGPGATPGVTPGGGGFGGGAGGVGGVGGGGVR